MQQDSSSTPLRGVRPFETEEGRSIRMKEEETDRKIEKYFWQETDRELCMKMRGMKFCLVRISLENGDTLEEFRPYCEGSPEGKYWVIWKAWPLQDRYVFDKREYAVDFIVMSRRWE